MYYVEYVLNKFYLILLFLYEHIKIQILETRKDFSSIFLTILKVSKYSQCFNECFQSLKAEHLFFLNVDYFKNML